MNSTASYSVGNSFSNGPPPKSLKEKIQTYRPKGAVVEFHKKTKPSSPPGFGLNAVMQDWRAQIKKHGQDIQSLIAPKKKYFERLLEKSVEGDSKRLVSLSQVLPALRIKKKSPIGCSLEFKEDSLLEPSGEGAIEENRSFLEESICMDPGTSGASSECSSKSTKMENAAPKTLLSVAQCASFLLDPVGETTLDIEEAAELKKEEKEGISLLSILNEPLGNEWVICIFGILKTESSTARTLRNYLFDTCWDFLERDFYARFVCFAGFRSILLLTQSRNDTEVLLNYISQSQTIRSNINDNHPLNVFMLLRKTQKRESELGPWNAVILRSKTYFSFNYVGSILNSSGIAFSRLDEVAKVDNCFCSLAVFDSIQLARKAVSAIRHFSEIKVVHF